MVITSTAKRYARAIFELAQERNELDLVLSELDNFTDLVESSSDLKKIISMPNSDNKLKIIEDLTKDRYSQLFADFIRILVKNNRAALFPQIREDFHARYDHLHARVRATVVTAVPLPKELTEAIKKRLEKMFNASLVIDNQIDKSILGGFVVKLNGKVLDASVLEKFKKLKMYLTQN